MPEPAEKKRSKRDQGQIRNILMQVWDPIGVRDIPGAADEYDSYVGPAYSMLMVDRADAAAIADYLGTIATQNMGLATAPALRQRCARAAAALIELRGRIEQLDSSES